MEIKQTVGLIIVVLGALLAVGGLIGLIFTGLIFIALQNWSALAQLAGVLVAGVIMIITGLFLLMRD